MRSQRDGEDEVIARDDDLFEDEAAEDLEAARGTAPREGAGSRGWQRSAQGCREPLAPESARPASKRASERVPSARSNKLQRRLRSFRLAYR